MQDVKYDNKVEIFALSEANKMKEFPYVGSIPAGFPAPSKDYNIEPVNILEKYMKNPDAIFLGRVSGISMNNILQDGYYIYMDRSLDMKNDDIAVCQINGENTLKTVKIEKDRALLLPLNPEFPIITISKEERLYIIAIVILIVRPTPARQLRL